MIVFADIEIYKWITKVLKLNEELRERIDWTSEDFGLSEFNQFMCLSGGKYRKQSKQNNITKEQFKSESDIIQC